MNYKVGQFLYSVYVDEESGKSELMLYVVRTIRGGYVHIISKNSITWVKKSKKHLDWGWADNIPGYCRYRVAVGEKSVWLHTTKLAAWKDALTDEYTPDAAKPNIKRQITKYRNSGRKK